MKSYLFTAKPQRSQRVAFLLFSGDPAEKAGLAGQRKTIRTDFLICVVLSGQQILQFT